VASPPQIFLLSGPTAVGKTALALQWAEQFDAEIVSADSLLFYRGMDIGTAKPSREELTRIPHHLIDIRSVDAPMNIADYVDLARSVIADILGRGRRVLVTGGSGFYLKAFFGPVVDAVKVPPALRREIEEQLAARGLGFLVAELRRLNPAGLGELDLANPRRVTRALERCRASGKTLAELKTAFTVQPGPFADYGVQGVRLGRDFEELYQRIEQRVNRMIDAGLEQEVAELEARGLRHNPSAARSIGYRETLALQDGDLAREDWPDEIVRNTKTLARKQRTWFRQQLPELKPVAAATADPATLFEV